MRRAAEISAKAHARLVVFGGLPGVDTAFYATQFGYEKGDDNNVRALLEQLKDQAGLTTNSSQEMW